ncbi:MAG: ATP-binding protein [Muribaculaceae bacterium]|nr:ATP-binding protein [Muribaculaceae bacterium]
MALHEYIHRKISKSIDEANPSSPVIVITGPRQVGKTTLCRHHFECYNYYNLEDASFREIVSVDPKRFITECGEKTIIDEAQHLPELFSYIQLAVDNDSSRHFVLTGSSNISLLENVTQSLAGRAALFTLLPFALDELGDYGDKTGTDTMLLRGMYPGVIVKGTPHELFFRNYYTTYVERDVRQIKSIENLAAFQTFVKLVAGRVGSEFNASAISAEVGISSPTAKAWLGILQTSYIAFQMQPYYANINKRLAKMPKIYFYDTGLLCFLLGITTVEELATHPLRGSIFENFAVVELLKARFNDGKDNNLYFYRENSGREVDIIQTSGVGLNLFEIKSSMTFNRDFMRNINYLKELFGDKVKSARVVYDGESVPPTVINIRRLP